MSQLPVLRAEPMPVAWSGHTNAVVVDSASAIDRLPAPQLDPYERLAVAFLVGYPKDSSKAYGGDLRAWGQWCASMAVHPFDARRHHVDAWVRVLSTKPLARSTKPMAAASIARRLSAVAQLYDYGIEVEVLNFSPVATCADPRCPTTRQRLPSVSASS